MDAAQGGDELGAIRGGQNRPPGALQAGDGPIVVHRDDQPIGFSGRALQIPHVPDMQQIEAAVRKRNRLSRRTLARNRVDKLLLRNHHGS